MKTQIIKIIPCLLAGFILSACVGAVNVPSSVVESATQTPKKSVVRYAIPLTEEERQAEAEKLAERDRLDDERRAKLAKELAEFEEEKRLAEVAESERYNACRTNPFEDTCYEDGDDFIYEREEICEDETQSARCESIVAYVCRNDSRDYFGRKRKLCRYHEADKARAEAEAKRIQDANDRAIAIENNKRAAESRKVANANTCARNPFASVCGESFNTARETACITEPNSNRCEPTIARVCAADDSGALCRSSNLKMRDLPVGPSNRFSAATGVSFSSSCGYYGCRAGYPSIINIAPLNDNNSGMATYAGELLLDHYSNNSIFGRNDRITKNIDIIVDFDNNMLSYSDSYTVTDNTGMVGFNYIHSYVSKNFRINGSFTDRGQITGSVTFGTGNGHLIGLIGQNEAIGVFVYNVVHQGQGGGGLINGARGGFAGSFTVTRE